MASPLTIAASLRKKTPLPPRVPFARKKELESEERRGIIPSNKPQGTSGIHGNMMQSLLFLALEIGRM